MPKLNEEEQEIQSRMDLAYERLMNIPESEIIRLPNGDKYASPIGVDDTGRPFVVDYEEKVVDEEITNEPT